MSSTWSYLLMVSLGIRAMGAGPEDSMYIPAGVYRDGRCVFGFKPSPREAVFTVPPFRMKRGSRKDCFVYDPSGFFDRMFLRRHFEELTKRVGLSINYTDIGICRSGDTNIRLRLAGEEYPMRKVIRGRRTIQQASRAEPHVDEPLDLSSGSRGQREGADGAKAGKSANSDVAQPSSSNKRTADTDSSSPRPAKVRTTQAEGVNIPDLGQLLGLEAATQPMSFPPHSPEEDTPTAGYYDNAEPISGFEKVRITLRQDLVCTLEFFLSGEKSTRIVGPGKMEYSRHGMCYQFDTKNRSVVSSLGAISRKLREKNLPGLYVASVGVCRSETSEVLELKLWDKRYRMKAE
ncbi:hypothetical protein FOZ62_005076 [Perkinsus olseni]|uniref:Uncharacterized protein n=1 Tax=Perkinsus olseni TaxID=32597 RepID=A0A7J6RM27_PEROL|nr:hypothetical protein FOZ62_005076 [Perkinsus olseni]